jgi:hypothetical protein
MQIVNRAEDYTSSDPMLNPPIVEGQANPMRRDTVTVPEGSSVSLRVLADNPGVWMLHCVYPSFSLFMWLTAVPYRSHRVAPGGRPRGDLHRSATGDATACPGRASTAYNARTAVPRTKSAGLGQRGRSRVHDRSVRPADGAVPAE